MRGSQRPCVAVVDDDESVRESVVGLIESVGYDATFFTSAEEFLGSTRAHSAACVILDVRLPGMSGLELFSQLQKNERRLPTIFITAHADSKARAWAIEMGSVAFLYKPFHADALLDAVRAALAISRGRDGSE